MTAPISTPALSPVPPAPANGGGLRWLFAALLCLLCAVGLALGVWQLERLQWKKALIARVDARVHAAPVAPPPAARWETVRPSSHEYLRVVLSGHWEPPVVWVRASTELGWGYWLLRPLAMDDGAKVLINQGFVPADDRAAVANRLAGQNGQGARVEGLLRMSEPAGWLQANDPANDRWASRDIEAIGRAMALDPRRTAPYFVDASAIDPPAGEWPRPGLTVLRFSDNHLSYAVTWFILAGLCAAGCALVLRVRRETAKES